MNLIRFTLSISTVYNKFKGQHRISIYSENNTCNDPIKSTAKVDDCHGIFYSMCKSEEI